MSNDQPRDGETTLPAYIGPYESWIFGEGLMGAFPAIRRFKKGTPLAAVAELASHSNALGKFGASMPTDIDGTEDPEKTEIRIPTIWEPVEGSEGFAPKFIPFVVTKHSFEPGQGAEKLAEIFRDQSAFTLPGVLKSDVGGRSIPTSRFRINYPVAKETLNENFSKEQVPHIVPNPETVQAIKKSKRLTIIAVIDDGLPFAHRNFLTADGNSTRIESCWLQSAGGNSGPGIGDTVLFGNEYTRTDIDTLINQYGHDEDELYRQAGASDALPELGSAINRHTSHGSNILDLAAGYGPRDGLPPADTRIISVQLPNTVAWDTSGFGKDMYMLAAFHYIFQRADQLRGAYADAAGIAYEELLMPLVVNFSYGFAGGPHDHETGRQDHSDGGIELEQAIDEMIAFRRDICKQPTAVTIPTGNLFSSRLHAVVKQDAFNDKGDSAELFWRIQPNDRTISYLEIWFPPGTDAGDYEITVIPPRLNRHTLSIQGYLNHGGADVWRPSNIKDDKGAIIGQLSVDLFRNKRWRGLCCIAPTEPEPFQDHNGKRVFPAVAPAGKWVVEIRKLSNASHREPILAWIQRDEDPEQFRSGSRQSYFDMPSYKSYDVTGKRAEDDEEEPNDNVVVRRFGSINGLATGKRTLAVAGYSGSGIGGSLSGARLAPYYSSAGPKSNRAGFEKEVGCAGLSDIGPATPGRLAAGTRSGSFSRVIGTSTAAPQVARRLAEAFADTRNSIEVIETAAEENYVGLLPGNPVTPDDLLEVRFGSKFVKPVRVEDRP